MSGFNISNRQIALFLMAVATLWALAEGAALWLVAAIALPPLLYAASVWWCVACGPILPGSRSSPATISSITALNRLPIDAAVADLGGLGV